MKIVVIIFVLFVAFVAAEENEDESVMMVLMTAEFESCKKSMNPSNETLELIIKEEGDVNRDVQCFKACVWKKAGFFTDAKLNMDKLESILLSDEETDKAEVKEIMTVIKNCKDTAEVSNDECEVAAAYTKCTQSEI